MAVKKVAPYGEWQSPISVDDATAGSKVVSSPRGDVRTGRGFFLEATPEGASTIVEVIPAADGSHELKHVLPDPHRVGTAVYEYGGGAYEIIPSTRGDRQRIIFSDAGDDNALKLLDVNAGSVRTLVGGKPWLRYADFGPSPLVDGGATMWVLAIQEDHTNSDPAHVKDDVVAINIDTGDVKKVASGADFYTTPRYSPDGKWIAYRSWNHPEMSWTRSHLHLAEALSFGEEGPVLEDKPLAAGVHTGEAVGEFAWGPDGALYFTQEVAGDDWRQMFRVKPGHDMKVEKLDLEGLEEVELGNNTMGLDNRTFSFLSESSMVLTYDRYATHSTVHVDLKTLKITPLEVPIIDVRDAISAITPTSFLMVGAGAKTPQGVYHFALDAHLKPTMTQLQTTASKAFPEAIFSKPEHIQLVSKHDPKRPIHGFYWPPHNPDYTAPEGALPPLIVNPHGGPTGQKCAGLSIGGVAGGNVPFYTSRGFAYFVINYTGSTGHGKAYRQRLNGQWGVLDRDDVPECVDYLCATGRADRGRVGIHGGSAGGYNVLQSLVWHPEVFAGGVCYCGVSDVKALGVGTHKLESHYLYALLYEPGMSEKDKERLNYERSPIFHAERIKAPLLLLHGDQDTVVPIQQSFDIERKVGDNGGVVKMVVAPGDGHMFTKQASRRLALESDIGWFTKYLVRT